MSKNNIVLKNGGDKLAKKIEDNYSHLLQKLKQESGNYRRSIYKIYEDSDKNGNNCLIVCFDNSKVDLDRLRKNRDIYNDIKMMSSQTIKIQLKDIKIKKSEEYKLFIYMDID